VEKPQSLAVVIPTYRSGLALWIGIGEALRWRSPRVRLTQIVIVDDGSPQCAFRDGTAHLDGADLTFLVNPKNRGQSEATWRGLCHVKADWALLLEDDLLDWPTAIDTAVSHIGPDSDLVSLARPVLGREAGGARAKVQPLVRRIFKWAGAGDLVDPTSPIKALRLQTLTLASLERWRRSLHEGLVVLSRRTTESDGAPLTWENRPSRYTAGRLLRVGANLWPRLLFRALRPSSKRAIPS